LRVAIYTLGCKVNQFESWAIEEEFQRLGCTIVNWKETADIYLINTCTVTARAAYQSRQMIRRFKRENPEARIIATGCHVQVDTIAILKSVGPGICLAGNEMKPTIAETALNYQDCTGIYVSDIAEEVHIAPLFLDAPPRGRTRAYLKIQDGCNAFCSYCIVPYARGRSRSLPLEKVMKQVEVFSSSGVLEIVLTGIHVGYYGRDLKAGPDLLGLFKQLCSRFPHIHFRLSSIEPTEISRDFIKWASETENFCPHFHIPLQSGSDKVLSAMNRNYTPGFFLELLESVAEAIPGCCLGTDIMTGFPTEEETDFAMTLDLLDRSPISYVHAFPYSARPGTVAAAMKPVCTAAQAKQRARQLRRLGAKKKQDFFHSFLGQNLELLVERRDPKTELFIGHTPNYIPVRFQSGQNLARKRVRVKIVDVQGDTVTGVLS